MTAVEVHRSSSITKPGYIRIPAPCNRCGGPGGWEGWPGWTCFQCGGSGQGSERVYAYPTDWTDEQVAEHVEQRQARADARAQQKAAKQAADHAAWLSTQSQALVDLIERRDDFDGFIFDVLSQGSRKPLSDRQVESVLAAVAIHNQKQAQAAAEAAAAEPLPLGRVTIEGEILTIRSQDSQYGSTLKMLVKGQGWRVWGTFPASLQGRYETPPCDEHPDGCGCRPAMLVDGAEQGSIVRFVATVEASDDDPAFGFFTRPSKAEVVKEAQS